MQQQNNAATSSDGIRIERLRMLRCPPRISTGTLLILLPALALGTALLTSCGSDATRAEIRFGIAGAAANAQVLQFYVHAIELIDEHGKPHPFRSAADAP